MDHYRYRVEWLEEAKFKLSGLFFNFESKNNMSKLSDVCYESIRNTLQYFIYSGKFFTPYFLVAVSDICILPTCWFSLYAVRNLIIACVGIKFATIIKGFMQF